jgi:hypothetical protein
MACLARLSAQEKALSISNVFHIWLSTQAPVTIVSGAPRRIGVKTPAFDAFIYSRSEQLLLSSEDRGCPYLSPIDRRRRLTHARDSRRAGD